MPRVSVVRSLELQPGQVLVINNSGGRITSVSVIPIQMSISSPPIAIIDPPVQILQQPPQQQTTKKQQQQNPTPNADSKNIPDETLRGWARDEDDEITGGGRRKRERPGTFKATEENFGYCDSTVTRSCFVSHSWFLIALNLVRTILFIFHIF